mmetsp:Transcript_12571/g.29143  ORF Transcript_12571/g.29143 Transcript_12571/m.29143 type:complete len:314 (+) Transcript_12571:266-1207(+)
MIEPEKGIFVARIVIEVKGPPTLGIVSIAIRPRDMKATGAGVHSLLQVGIDLVHNVRLVGNRQDLVFEPDLYLFFSFVILDKRKLKERQDGTNVSIVTVLELRSKGIGVRRGRIGLDLERLSDGLESHVAFEIRRRKERAVGFHAQVGSCGRLHVPHRVPIHHVVLVLGVILGQNHRKGPDPTAAVMGFVDPKWESCIHLGTKAHKGADVTPIHNVAFHVGAFLGFGVAVNVAHANTIVHFLASLELTSILTHWIGHKVYSKVCHKLVISETCFHLGLCRPCSQQGSHPRQVLLFHFCKNNNNNNKGSSIQMR